MNPSVYLSGPISGKTFEEANAWRTDARLMLEPRGIIALSPLRGKDGLKTKGQLHSQSYDLNALTTSKGFLCRDHFDTCRADALLVNFSDATSISIGTVAEIAWAYHLKKPVVMIPDKFGLYNHGFIEQMVPFIAKDVFDACNIVAHLLLP